MTWIDKGVANVNYDRYWAAKTGKEPNEQVAEEEEVGAVVGFGGGGLTMEGTDSLEDLIESVERGLLITHFWYIRGVNPQTLQHRADARRSVPDRERQNYDSCDEFPLPEKPRAAAEKHEEAGPGGPGERP